MARTLTLCLLTALSYACPAFATELNPPPGIDAPTGDLLTLKEVFARTSPPVWSDISRADVATAPEILAKADALLAQGRAFDVEALLFQVKDAEGLLRLGEAQMRLRQLDTAKATLAKVCAMDRRQASARLLLAEITGDLGLAAEAWNIANDKTKAAMAQRLALLLSGHPVAQAELLDQTSEESLRRQSGDMWMIAGKTDRARTAWGPNPSPERRAWALLADGKSEEAGRVLLSEPGLSEGAARSLQSMVWYLKQAPASDEFIAAMRKQIIAKLGSDAARRQILCLAPFLVAKRDLSLLSNAQAAYPDHPSLALSLAEARVSEPTLAADTLLGFLHTNPVALGEIPDISPALEQALLAHGGTCGVAISSMKQAKTLGLKATLTRVSTLPLGEPVTDLAVAIACIEAGEFLLAKDRLDAHPTESVGLRHLWNTRLADTSTPLGIAERRYLQGNPSAAAELVRIFLEARVPERAEWVARHSGLTRDLALALAHSGRQQEALELCNDKRMTPVESLLLRMSILDITGQTVQADEAMNELLRGYPNDADALAGAGHRLVGLGRMAEAKPLLSRSAGLQTPNATLLADWAKVVNPQSPPPAKP